MNEHIQLAISALQNLKGDDLYRARVAFRNCTPDELAEQYGQSGRTRNQILGEYEAHEQKVQRAIDYLSGIGQRT